MNGIMYSSIPHYYGNHVRVFFLTAAVLSFISIPLWGHLLPFGTTFEVIGGVVLIILAGLTSPSSRGVMIWNVVVSGFAASLLELSAISFKSHNSIELLIAREGAAVLLLAGLYFSVKTLRAMNQGVLGQWPVPWDFEKPGTKTD